MTTPGAVFQQATGAPGYRLPVAGKRPIRIEFSRRSIGVLSNNDRVLFVTPRTIECAEALADQLSAAHLKLEAEALRAEAKRWKW